MVYNQNITLDLNTNTSYVVVGAKQGDNSTRTITATILQDNEPYIIPENAIASYRVRKPNGDGTWNNAEIDRINNTVIITLTATDLSVSGRSFADILFTAGNERLATVSFIIDISAAPNITEAVIKSDAFGFLYGLVEQANNVIEDAQGWAEGKHGTEPVKGDSYSSPISSNPDLKISFNFKTFKQTISPAPIGKETTYIFTYYDGYWHQDKIIVNMTNLGFSIEGVPRPGDTVSITVVFADPEYHNNAKWFANSLKNTVATAKTIAAGSSAQVQTKYHDDGYFSFDFDIPAGAQGPQGIRGDQGARGIQGIQGNQGPQGIRGPAGRSIIGVSLGSDYQLIFEFSDGTFIETGSVRGATGPSGAPGASMYVNSVVTGENPSVNITLDSNGEWAVDFILPSLGAAVGIDDNSVALNSGWSSHKLNEIFAAQSTFNELTNEINGAINSSGGLIQKVDVLENRIDLAQSSLVFSNIDGNIEIQLYE